MVSTLYHINNDRTVQWWQHHFGFSFFDFLYTIRVWLLVYFPMLMVDFKLISDALSLVLWLRNNRDQRIRTTGIEKETETKIQKRSRHWALFAVYFLFHFKTKCGDFAMPLFSAIHSLAFRWMRMFNRYWTFVIGMSNAQSWAHNLSLISFIENLMVK